MHRHPALRARPALALAALAFALSACGDRGTPVDVTLPAPTPAEPLLLASLSCQGSVASRTVRCTGSALPADARGYIIVGGQDQYVHVGSSNPGYNAGTQVFSFDIAVQNLIPQPMGTTNGSTPDGSGVRVIFHSGPTVTGGSGAISVANATGTGAFTGASQPYFAYTGAELGGDGILSQNETSSAKTWQLSVASTITTFSFQLFVVAEVPFPNGYIDVSPAADTMLAGGAQALTATVRSAVGNVIPGQTITWGTGDDAVATVDGSGTVTGVGPGSTTITATSGARSGTAAIAVCPNLAVGGVYLATGGSFCIGTGAAAAEYTVSPVNLSISDLAYSVTGNGIVAVTGPPSPNRLPGAGGLAVPVRPVPDEAFHTRLQQREVDMAAAMRGARVRGPDAGVRRSITPGVPSVGTVMSLNVSQGFCTPLDSRASTVKSVGTHVILMEDNSNPAGGFSTAQYDSLAATFDTLVYPAVAGNFGAPFDIDANGGRVIALYTSAVNDLTPSGSGSYIGGFFYSRDLYSTGSCAGSNQGEMFYMLAPDPAGAHGNVRSAAFVRGVTLATLGHEFQHLINASRRTYGAGGPYPLEQVWLNEGLSHVAEEEVYYASSLHGPGENISIATISANQTQIDRFFEFGEANFGRLRQWLLRPDTAGPFKEADNLAIRGAAWAFLRYAADRKGGIESDLWSGLAFSPDTGMTNLANRLGTDPRPWFRDLAAAMYLDDSGTGAAATYTQPSWNFRSIYAGLDYIPGPGCSCAYELAVRNPANGVAQAFTVSKGAGSGYVRMGVAASAFAGVATTAPGTSLAVVVMRTK
jgi:hypothetical protein